MANWKNKLNDVVEEINSSPGVGYDLRQIYRIVSPPKMEVLVEELTDTVARGKLQVDYKVLSPRNRSPIGIFKKYADIPLDPPEIFDDTIDETVTFDPREDVYIYYFSP